MGCFTGDTKVPLLNGKELSLQELVELGGEHWVYAIDENHKITGAKATAKLTRHHAALMKVVLDNDEEIICTPDHQFMLRDGLWCDAKDLKPKTSLMPFYSQIDKGERSVQQPAVEHALNHKVKSVEPLDYKADVYCLTVPEYANFALSAGVFVHNCGMNALRLSLTANELPENLKKVRETIEDVVPVGFEMHRGRPKAHSSTIKSLDNGIEQIMQKHPAIAKMSRKPRQAWAQQLGTLGGGNHFIELCLDENQDVWIMLHSGSRGIGNNIGRYFIGLAKKDMENHIAQLPHKDLAYFPEGTQYFDDYVQAVHWAQDYAMWNRKEMMRLILDALKKVLPVFSITKEAINCHHNYVSIEQHFGEQVFLTRKGAISAQEGELGIIPGSMGAKSFIVRGKGNPDAFCSCSHGAGRKMSRTKAKKSFDVSDMEQQTEGVECRKDKGGLDEIPGAYKDIDTVIEHQNDLVDVVHTLKQVVCVKG
ncbi:RtcB family protein [Candidatus Albibeggiatoa sp. nov. BB20]|uniref:RtcB family protein n=1 Tax=Candidatus Albibeggiatoa sp. nov. BB20 TaxID=3162723 RepID=UPI0033654160